MVSVWQICWYRVCGKVWGVLLMGGLCRDGRLWGGLMMVGHYPVCFFAGVLPMNGL